MQLPNFIPLIVAFIVTLLGVKLMLHFFPKWGFLDRPDEYGLTRKPIPYSGGIVFFIVFLISIFLFVPLTHQMIGVIVAATLITGVSFLDDRVRQNPWLRLGIQVLSGVIIVFAGVKIQIISNPIAYDFPIRLDHIEFNFLGQNIWLFSGLFIIAWLTLMMNVMNWLDGIPGLTSGISTIAQISLFILSMRQFHVVDQSTVITLSSVLAASTLAFLIFDFPSPKILMGDTGSMFLGFMLGILSILAGGKLATALLIMGFPVLDAFWVILKRMLQGKSPMQGDYSHFHHRLLRIGLSERKALLTNFILCALCAAIVLILPSTYYKFLAFMGIFVVMAIISVIIFIGGKFKKNEY